MDNIEYDTIKNSQTLYEDKHNTRFKFSVVMAVYNCEEYIENAIESIINQTLGFKDNIQLIIIDDGSTDNSLKHAKEFQQIYPENIKVITKVNEGQAIARNLGLKYALGEYINFLDSDDYISKNAFEEVYSFFKENEDEIDIVSIPIQLFGRINGPHRLNYKFEESGVIDLIKQPNNPQLSASSSFFKKELFNRYQFDTSIITSEDAILINKILLEKQKYGVLNSATYYYRLRSDSSSTIDTTLDKKDYYTTRLKFYFLELIECSKKKHGKVLDFIAYTLAYDLQWIIKKEELDVFDSEEEIKEFWDCLHEVISYIHDDAIINNQNILEDYKGFFYFLKKNDKKIDTTGNEITVKIDDYVLDRLSNHKLGLDVVEIRRGNLILSGIFKSYFDENDINIIIIKHADNSTKRYETQKLSYANPERKTTSFLSIPWKSCINFNVKLPLTNNVEKYVIAIELPDGNGVFYPNFVFNEECNLSTSSIYIVKDNHILLYQSRAFHIVPYRYKTMLRYEASCMKKIVKDRAPQFMNALFYHTIFMLLYPLLKNKRIWLFADRPEFSDDNGRHLFEYAMKQDDDIKKYFIIDKKSEDYDKLAHKYHGIIAFKSLKHKVLHLFAEKYIGSYVNEEFTNPFLHDNKKLYKGFLNIQRVFLQHGVTKDNISYFVNKFRKNLYMLLTVSDYESNSFKEDYYNFDEDVIQCLGFPRFDNLTSDVRKKQILFMPTWRVQLQDSHEFVESDYFGMLNDILNNNQLHEYLESTGYELVFKPHPELMPHVDLINSEYARISTDESYQKLFGESSLLITDYSSVFFDFAYLKKPVIYYHATDDYHYTEGYFDYRTMGFGEVIESENDLIKIIKEYIDCDCKMKEKYEHRVEKFFKYNDKNNCKRVYDWLKNH